MTIQIPLLGDPRRLAEQLTRSDRQALRARHELFDPRHPAWLASPEPELGRSALRVLAGSV